MTEKKPIFKSCVVSDCESTTDRNPKKLFFPVPKGERREAWNRALGRADPEFMPLHPKVNRYCCEDHFDIKNDMENYMRWKMMMDVRASLKKDVVPTKFSCQNKVFSDIWAPVDIKDEDSETDDAVDWESDVIEVQDSELSDFKDDSIDDQCGPYAFMLSCQNKLISDTCTQIEITPVDMQEDASDTDEAVDCESDVIDLEDSELSDSKDDAIDDQCRPYIVSIIHVKIKKRRLT